MSFDSISSSSIPAASNAKNLAEKKRGNNSAEFMKDKLDVGDLQWLAQGKEGCEEELSGGGEIDFPPMHAPNGRDQATRALEVTSDSDLSSNSPSSLIGSVANLSGSSNGTFVLINISEVEDGGELDDWEALADALAATDDKKDQHDQKFELLVENEIVIQLDHLPEVVKQPTAIVDVSKKKLEKSGVENGKVTRMDQPTAKKDFRKPKPENDQAWRRNGCRSKPRPENGQAWRREGFRSKPRPENGQAWRRTDAFRSKPRPESQAWRNRNAFHGKSKPENGQAWRKGDAFHGKSKPDNGQAWRRDAFRWKPKPEKCDPKSKSLVESKNVTQLDHLPEVMNQPTATMDVWKPKPENGQATVDVLKPKSEKAQAQRHGDAFLPKTLTNQQKKPNYPMNNGGTTLGCKNFVSPPSSCPICCEDLDITDSSFLPCSCGFQLCLFCHKRIHEEDGRCPGCRKHYDNCPV